MMGIMLTAETEGEGGPLRCCLWARWRTGRSLARTWRCQEEKGGRDPTAAATAEAGEGEGSWKVGHQQRGGVAWARAGGGRSSRSLRLPPTAEWGTAMPCVRERQCPKVLLPSRCEVEPDTAEEESVDLGMVRSGPGDREDVVSRKRGRRIVIGAKPKAPHCVGVKLSDDREIQLSLLSSPTSREKGPPPVVISTLGFVVTFVHLLPESIRTEPRGFPALTECRPVMNLLVRSRGSTSELNLTGADYYRLPVAALPMDEMDPAMKISFPSTKDPTFPDWHGMDVTTCVITIKADNNFARFFDTKQKIYSIIKPGASEAKWLVERVLKDLVDAFPQLKGKIECAELCSLTRVELSHNLEWYATKGIRCDMPYPGLFMGGSDLTVGDSFSGGTVSGWLIANAIAGYGFVDLLFLDKNITTDLEQFLNEPLTF